MVAKNDVADRNDEYIRLLQPRCRGDCNLGMACGDNNDRSWLVKSGNGTDREADHDGAYDIINHDGINYYET